MPVIFGSLVIFGILLLFIRTKTGQTLLFIWVLLVALNLMFIAFEEESYEKFVERNNLNIDKRNGGMNTGDGLPWYASDENNYYYIVPGFYRVMPKENSCSGFSRFDVETWCISELDEFKCYPDAGENCGFIPVKSPN